MCGIFGIISHNAIESEQFTRLGQLNTERGNLAFGGIVIHQGQVEVYRYAMPFDGNKVPLNGSCVALGHVKAPTGRQSNRPYWE